MPRYKGLKVFIVLNKTLQRLCWPTFIPGNKAYSVQELDLIGEWDEARVIISDKDGDDFF